jgi:sugar phosphate isomerase/epimerase
MENALAGHTNTYHTYTFDEALDGIAAAGYTTVELTAVEGWTEHVDLDADTAVLRAKLAHFGLEPVVLSGHSDLTTPEGVEYGIKAVRWCHDYGIPVMNTAIGGHASQDENESAFLAGIGRLAAAADEAGVDVALEIHGDIMATGIKSLPLLERIGHPRVKVAYDTGNSEFYGDTKAVDDIATMLPYLANIHLKDHRGGKGVWDFPEPGGGTVDFPGILAILERGGYTGPTSVECEFQGEPWPPLDEVNRVMKSAHAYLTGLGLGRG